jgi:hypothetical protein
VTASRTVSFADSFPRTLEAWSSDREAEPLGSPGGGHEPFLRAASPIQMWRSDRPSPPRAASSKPHTPRAAALLRVEPTSIELPLRAAESPGSATVSPERASDGSRSPLSVTVRRIRPLSSVTRSTDSARLAEVERPKSALPVSSEKLTESDASLRARVAELRKARSSLAMDLKDVRRQITQRGERFKSQFATHRALTSSPAR